MHNAMSTGWCCGYPTNTAADRWKPPKPRYRTGDGLGGAGARPKHLPVPALQGHTCVKTSLVAAEGAELMQGGFSQAQAAL